MSKPAPTVRGGRNLATKVAAAGIARCDAIEPLGEASRAFWILDPSSIVHLICPEDAAW